MVNYADCLYSLIQKGCMSISVYNLSYKSSGLFYGLGTFCKLSQEFTDFLKKIMFQRGDLIRGRLVL